MKKFNYCFVDLDDTIFDTRKFKEDIYNVFLPTGINKENFIKAYRRAAELPKLGYYNYTYERQIEAVREMGYEVSDESLALLNNLLEVNYLKAGAKEFLDYLKIIAEKLMLLTAGTINFQAKKIDSIGVKSVFDEIIQIPGGKDIILEKYVNDDQRILFINDNLDENLMLKNKFSNIEIFTIFNPSYWTEADCAKSGLKYFKNYEDIIDHIQSNNF